jgi:hypothetical protein
LTLPLPLARGLHHCSAPHKAAHQQTAMNPVQRNDWFVAPPAITPGLRQRSAQAKPVSCGGDCPVLRLFCFGARSWLLAPPALAPGLQRCCTYPPQRALFVFGAPPAPCPGAADRSAPHKAAHQQTAMNPVQRNDWFVAPPALAPGLRQRSAQAKPVSCGGDCPVLRLFCFGARSWLVAPPALAPGLQRCSTTRPPQTRFRLAAPLGAHPTSSAALNRMTRVFLGLLAPPALAPGLQRCSTTRPPQTLFRLAAPLGARPTSSAALNLMTRVFLGLAAPPALAPGLQR